MKKRTACAAVVLLALVGSEARAQIISRPPTTSYGRVPISPYGGSLFGGSLYGYGPGLGLYGPGLYGPSGPAATAPGYAGTGLPVTGRTSESAANGADALRGGSSGYVTGHPTRFLYYGHYFLNQGGGTTTTGPTTPTLGGGRPPETAILIGGDYARSRAGAAPARPTKSSRR
jgi:hypothetical protein